MIKKILHIGVAVKDLKISTELFTALFETPPDHTENVPEQNAAITFFPLSESSIELIESTVEDSSISRFIERRGEGVHHICLEVDDINQEISRLRKLNFQFVNDVPSDGGDGFKIVFLHPSSTNGVLIELAEKIR